MNRLFCDLCNKEIKDKKDSHSFQVTKYNHKNTSYQTINHGDYHYNCIKEIFKQARIMVKND